MDVLNHLLWEIHQLLVNIKSILFIIASAKVSNNLVKPSLRYWFYNSTINMYVDLPWQRAKKYLTIECLTGNQQVLFID